MCNKASGDNAYGAATDFGVFAAVLGHLIDVDEVIARAERQVVAVCEQSETRNSTLCIRITIEYY